MIDPSSVRFPSIDKAFLRGLFWLLVFLLLASVFSVAQGIYDILIQRPEVRQVTLKVGEDADFGAFRIIQRAIVIHNRGNADAKSVTVRCMLPNGQIDRMTVVSEEDYLSVQDADVSNPCHFSIERLAADSKFVLLVWATISPASLSDVQLLELPLVSATYDGGTAAASDRPTAFEEVQTLGARLTRGLSVISYQIGQKVETNSATQTFVNQTLPNWGIYLFGFSAKSRSQFLDALITIAMLSAAAWLLLPRVWAGLTLGILLTLFIWLYSDFQVSALWMVIPILFAGYALFFQRAGQTTTHTTTTGAKTVVRSLSARAKAERAALILFAVASFIWLLNAVEWNQSYVCITAYWNGVTSIFRCVQTTVHGGIWIGSTLFVVYLLFFDF